MISPFFAIICYTELVETHIENCHRNWGYLHFLFINHSDHSPLKTRVMILNFCRIIQFGDPNAVSVQIAQKQGPCLEVTLDQEKENLIRAKTVLSGM